MAERKNFDSDFCGNLPLHHINSIQDYGYLLVLDINHLKVIQASENVTELFNIAIEQVIDTHLSAYLLAEDMLNIEQIISKGLSTKIPLTLGIQQSTNEYGYDAIMHVKADHVIIEIEKEYKGTTRSFTEVYQEIKYSSVAIGQAQTVQEVCDIAILELQKLSGFDGILMYQFDKEWNGTVVAEQKDDRLEHYLGQTFPASDVPKQARALYLKNPYRLIPKRDYQPVRLYPVINPLTFAFTDLSDCNLRGVAGVHLEYMENMGINASMSIRVIYKENLWGLISCHHIDQKYINYELCSIFEWLSDVISGKITQLLNREEYLVSQALQQKRVALADQVYATDSIALGLLKEDEANLLDLFKATAAVVSLNGRLEVKGTVPAKDELENLLLWLEGKNLEQIFSTNHLSGLYEDAAEYSDEVSGLLVIPIDHIKGDFVVCFRPEVIEDINWGGDPNQAINFANDGKNYHPRNSFKLWKQTVRQYALPWTPEELAVAESLRSFLFEFRTKQLQH